MTSWEFDALRSEVGRLGTEVQRLDADLDRERRDRFDEVGTLSRELQALRGAVRGLQEQIQPLLAQEPA